MIKAGLTPTIEKAINYSITDTKQTLCAIIAVICISKQN